MISISRKNFPFYIICYTLQPLKENSSNLKIKWYGLTSFIFFKKVDFSSIILHIFHKRRQTKYLYKKPLCVSWEILRASNIDGINEFFYFHYQYLFSITRDNYDIPELTNVSKTIYRMMFCIIIILRSTA